jgi:hypothetical protein
MEEIAEGECDSCGIVESSNTDSSQRLCVCGPEVIFLGGSMASGCGNVWTLLELVTLIEAEVDGLLEVTMLDVTTECPLWLFDNCCNFEVMLELGVPMVIPKEVSSDIDSCSVVKDMFPVDMSFVEGSRRERFMGTSVWLRLYSVIKSTSSSVLDCI